ncbi:MAG: 3-oxo-5-alpha-steroid 4-dehydrogenase [Myxococcales bacterium]|nr:3-oxo-5-alpha-steroid 4-dehydrogenase [Myxococcales bacterium]
MIGAIAERIAIAWVNVAVLQAGLWFIARRTKNAGIVDVGWALAFSLVATIYAFGTTAPAAGWLPISLVVMLWSARLGVYLLWRGAATGPEEGRYSELRRRWQPNADRGFFALFQAQAALTAVLSIAFVVPFIEAPWDGGLLRALAIVIAVAGIAGESVADLQLARWKRDPANRGMVCDVGLWGYSRHPNYFFEWCVWLGFAVYSLAFHGGWIALLAQAIIFASIFGVTGIPPTENQAIRSKGDAYRAYQARVSKFVPRPPKRA